MAEEPDNDIIYLDDDYPLPRRSFAQIAADCVALKEAKSLKYKRGEDDLSGFREAASKANIPLTGHIFSRVVDKEGRLGNYLRDNIPDIPAMVEECMDMVNYLIFEIIALEEIAHS